MKITLHHILFSTCIALFAFVNFSYSQDSNTSDYEVTDPERDKLERDKILYSPGEGDTRYIPKSVTPSQAVSKDSISIIRPTPAPPPKVKTEQPAKASEKQQQSKDDDSILSFNFLYYIIQKYKLQDVID